MTNYEDTILGVSVSNGQTTRTYTSHKVEYDSTESLTDLLESEREQTETNEDGEEVVTDTLTLQEYVGQGSLKDKEGADGTYTDVDGNEVSYNRRVLVEDAATKDAVVAELDSLDVPNETSDVSISAKERHVIEREGAQNAREIEKALLLKAELLDRELVEDDTKEPIAQAIKGIKSNDPELGGALDNVFEVMTGETSDELLTRLSQ